MQVKDLVKAGPYYDDADFAETQQYYKMLFIPARAVQARELTQLQSLQHFQIKRLGDHLFKNGSLVIPGQISFDTRYKSIIFDVSDFSDGVKTNLQNVTYQKNNIIGSFLTDGQIKAVVDYITNVDNNTIKLYIKYISGNSGQTEYSANSVIDLVDAEDNVILNDIQVGTKGYASSATITPGVFYINGLFCTVHGQSKIIADSATPDLSVGLNVNESIVTENIDSSLVDPASGFSNFAAPGAHRHKISLDLVALDPEDVIEDNDHYIELLRLRGGSATKIVTRSTYNILADEFARRTYDESGDYTVRPFIASVEDNELDDTVLNIAVEAGKAYVKGYEIETISKITLSTLEKSRDFQIENNRTIHTPVGNYIIVHTPTEAFPDVSNYGSANIYDIVGAQIGTLRVRQVLPLGTVVDPLVKAGSFAQYKLSIFDIRMNASKKFEEAFSIGSSAGKIYLKLDLYKLPGLVSTSAGNAALTGNPDTRFSSLIEYGLPIGAVIAVGADASNPVEYRKVNTVTDNDSAGMTANFTYAKSNVSYYVAYATIKDIGDARLLFPLGYNRIKSIRDASDLVDTNYVYTREATGAVSSNTAILTAPVGSDEFISTNPADYIVFSTTTPGAPLASPNSVSISGNQATLTWSALANQNIKVFTQFRDTNAPEKNKTYTPNVTYTFAASGVNAAMTTADFWLPNADIHSIVSIVDGSANDITEDYTWDNGQNDSFYDLGRVTLKPGKVIPASVTVTYNYFAHSSGTYFSVNSYSVNLIETGKGYKHIPTYISKSDGKEWDLRDCLDFRPTINATRTGFAYTSNLPYGYVSADFQYYLNRVDVLTLNAKGEFKVIKGIPGLDPRAPNIPSDSMALYQIQVRAYTFDKSDVFTKYIENKRYTMRDIGKLDTQIQNLNYYVTLSLLEKDTADLEILDENGLNRFKNGFIVDPFNGHGIGDVTNPEYRCSIDMQKGECRPMFTSNSLGLKVNDIGSVQKTGDLILLPYTTTVFINQPLATEFLNINPYNVFTFLGRLELVPPLDVWKDTTSLPALIVNQEGNYDSMATMANSFGTVWGEWETQWTGKDVDRDVKRKVIAEGNNKPDRAHKSKWPDLVERTVTTTTTLTGTSTREGTRLVVTPQTVTTDLGSKVVDVSYLPFMRSIDVQFTGKGFKPGSRLYAFFDGVNVSAHCSTGTTFNPSALINSVPLVADATGFCQGVFRIPGNGTFRTGKRQFTLSDSATDSTLTRTTFGSAIFEASGLLETKQNTILSTRNAIVTQETLIDSKTVTDTQTSTKTTVKWEDPLAQSFLISEEGGCFVSGVDLYFSSKDANIPVIVYIAEMVNGYPSQNIVPFSQVIVPASSITANTITDVTTSAQLTPTHINFPSPVYLQQNCEYALVLISNSNAYNVAICTGGKPQIGTGVLTQSQPYLGTLFKSQNSSTWTTQQESDLMFKMYKCVFDTSTTFDCDFTNNSVPARAITGISYLKPVTTGAATTRVKIDIKNHGLNPTTGRITLAGFDAPVGDIPFASLNGVHRVTYADLDYVVIEIPSVTHTGGTGAQGAIVSGSVGSATAITNLPYDSLYLNVRNVSFPQTELKYAIKTTIGVHPQNTSALSSEYVTDAQATPCMVNQTLEFTDSRKIFVSDVNDQLNVSEPLAFSLIAEMSSDNPNISPIIDTAGLAVFTIENDVDSPDKDFKSDFDVLTLVSGASVVRNATTSTLSVATTTGYFTPVRVGQYITITGSTGGDDKDFLVTDKVDDGTNQILTVSPTPATVTESITVKLNTKYVDEISPTQGSAKSKYICRNFQLNQSASAIQIKFAAYWPNSFDIDVYYKTLPVSGNRIFNEQKYVKAEQAVAQVYSDGPLNYREYTYDINNLEEFVALSGKLVFKGLNGNDVPKIQDLRVIALT